MRSPTTRAIVGLLLLTGVATWGAKQTGFLTGSILESETMQFRAQSAYAVQQDGVLTIPSGTDVQLDWSRVDGQMFNGFEAINVTDCYLYASSDIDGLVSEKVGAPTILDNLILNESSYVRQYGVRTVHNIMSSRAFTLKCYFQYWYTGQISLVSSQTIQVNVGSGIDTSNVQPYAHRAIVYPPALSPSAFTLTSGAAVSGSDNVLDVKPGSQVVLQWKIDPVVDVNPSCALEISEPVTGAVISSDDLAIPIQNGVGGVYWHVKKQGSLTIPNVTTSLMVSLQCSQPFDSQGYGSAFPFYVFRSIYVQPQPQCDDGKDNDADGSMDFPADSDCAGLADNSENIPVVASSSSSAMSAAASSAGLQACSKADAGYCGTQGCAGDLLSYNNHTYLRYDTAAISWQNARAHCQGIGGDLVSITSSAEQSAVYNGLVGTNRSDLWIGMSDIANEGSMKLVDGSTPTYTNFYTGNPDDGYSNEDCVEMNYADYEHNGKWNDFPCDNGYGLISGFICELPKDCGASSSAPAMNCSISNPSYCGPKGCPAAFMQYGGHEYTRHDTPAGSWQDARAHCQATGGDLVTIGSSGEQAAIFTNFMGGNRHDVWIGLTDSAQEGTWRWIDGTTPSYTNWHPGEPDSSGPSNDQDCGQLSHLNFVKWDGKWSDGDCPNGEGLNTGFICEYSNQCGTTSSSSSKASSSVAAAQCNDGIDNDNDGATDALVELTDPNAGAERTFTHEEVRLALNALSSSLVPSDIPADAAVSSTLATAIQFCEKMNMQIRSVAGVDKAYFSFFNQNYNTSAGKQYGWNGTAFVLNGDPHTQNLIWVKCASLSSIQCNDGLDNDTDGSKDFPADIGCATVNDNSEVPHDLDCDSPDDIMEAGSKGNSANVVDPSRPGFGGMSFDGNNLVLMPMQGGNSSDDGNVLLFGPVFMPAVCGNGVASSNEQCDDGNTNDNDGCSSKCIWEPYTAGAGFCGDGQCILPEVRTSLMQSAYVPGSTWVLCPQDCDIVAAAAGSSAYSSSSAFSFYSSEPSSSAASSDAFSSSSSSSSSFRFGSSSSPSPFACFPGTLCPTGDLCPENGICPTMCVPGTRCPNGETCTQGGICPATFSRSSAPSLAPAAGDECIPGTFCSDGQICLENGLCPEPLPATSSSSAPSADTSTCAGNLDCPSNLCINGYCGCTTSAQCGGNACVGGFCTNIPAGMLAFDACASDAQCPAGMFCQGGDCVGQTARCGDGRVDAGEACDDGNAIDTDGCTLQCLLGKDSSCESPLQCQSLICTDGICGVCTGDTQCPDAMICSGGWCVSGSRSGVLADGVVIPSELAALLASGTGFGLYQDGTTYEQYQAMLLQHGAPHAPVGNTGPESVAIMAAGASAGYTWMKLRRKRKS